MPIPDERGDFRGYSGVGKDITESKMTKQSLEEQLKFETLRRYFGAGNQSDL